MIPGKLARNAPFNYRYPEFFKLVARSIPMRPLFEDLPGWLFVREEQAHEGWSCVGCAENGSSGRGQDASETRLLLRAEMKVPGKAWLQFCFAPLGDGRTELRSIASFEPRGLFGRLYWWSLYPLHQLIFRGMLRAITKLAESRSRSYRTRLLRALLAK